jgi:hypothetical protein
VLWDTSQAWRITMSAGSRWNTSEKTFLTRCMITCPLAKDMFTALHDGEVALPFLRGNKDGGELAGKEFQGRRAVHATAVKAGPRQKKTRPLRGRV